MLPQALESLFEKELLAEIERHGRLVTAKAGDVIIDIGQAVKVVPLITTGTVKVSRMDEEGRELLLYYISPGESCAMTFTCCMEHYPSEIRAVAEDDVEFLAIPVQVLDQWMMKYPSWKSYVMKSFRSRFNEMLKTIDQIAFSKLDERLVHYLKEKSRATGSSLINLSHEQIAQELATSRVVVSRLLKKLENEKKVLLYRNQLKLLSDL